VSGGIETAQRAIEALADDLAVQDHHGTHRHFTECRALRREFQRPAHEAFVGLLISHHEKQRLLVGVGRAWD